MDSVKQGWIEGRMKGAVEKLKAHDFEATCVKTKEEAVKEIWRHVTPEMKVGVGGSMTIREIGILDQLRAKGHLVYDHWVPGLSREESLRLRKFQMSSDLFLSSSNAVTMNGELVNIDGAGNRVNSITFGPGKVILVSGFNKLVEDIQEAIKRIKNVVTPMNARRLNIEVPCAKLGHCVDCNSPDRLCRAVVILERKPLLTDMLVILVGEELGY
jgi:L-lactate utilization protein LutB